MNVCTVSGLNSLGTSLGLSQTTGYSPYMPLLALAVATKWFHLCTVNHYFSFIIADWFIILVAALTLIDLVVDLVPAVSSGWHAIHTAITPFIGGFVAAATAPSLPFLHASSTGLIPTTTLASHMALLAPATTIPFASLGSIIVMFVVGFLLSGLVHLHRFGGRGIANIGHAFTLGLSNVVISVLEDIVAFVSILLSFLAPVVMLVIVICVVLFIIVTFRYVLRGIRFVTGGTRMPRKSW